MIDIRPYQSDAVQMVRAAMQDGGKRVVLVLPTGAGKTRTGAAIVERAVLKQRSIVWLAHRTELVEQTAKTLHDFGLPVGVVAASSAWPIDSTAPVQVCSVQTLLAREHRPAADLLIWDECHHVSESAPAWAAVLAAYPTTPTIGLTATPERGDGSGLAPLFDRLVVGVTVRELTAQGHLVPCEVVRPARLLKPGQLAQEPLAAYLEHSAGQQGFVFAKSVEEATRYATEFTAAGIRAVCIHAGTPPTDRAVAIELFKQGVIRLLCNVYIFTEGTDLPQASVCILARGASTAGIYLQMCLDEHTEILTRRGWLGPGDIREEDQVAAVDLSEEVPTSHWERPTEIVRRPMSDGESMVGIDSPRLDLRVTDQHTIFHRHRVMKGKAWSAWEASTATERMMAPGQYEIPSASIQDAIGVPLSAAELRVIGWYMTDGSISKATRALHIYQAEGGPFVNEIHRCLTDAGIRYGVNRTIPRNAFPNAQPRLTFMVSYGMPRKLVERPLGLRGYAHLARYMDKDLSPLLDDMTADQLAVLLEAMHWGDGSKQSAPGQTWTRRSFHIATSRMGLADRLQSMCLRRGWSCNVSTENRQTGPFYFVRAKRTTSRHVGGITSVDRPHLTRLPSVEGERVWCVTVSTGAIIVRRNGKAYIVGNCGRVLRPHRGKRSATLIDLRGVSHVHLMPEDERSYSLSGRGITSSEVAKCKVCSQALGPNGYPCACGYAPQAGDERGGADEVTSDPLVKFARMIAMGPEQRFETLVRWLRAADAKGHKRGAVRHKWRHVYGELPDASAWARACVEADRAAVAA